MDVKAAWRAYFASIECGQQITPSALLQLCTYTEVEVYQRPDEDLLRGLPCLRRLEASLHRCKPSRAAGPDLLPPEICAQATRWMSHYLAPLYLKYALYTVEPIQWKGRILYEVFKQKGRMDLPENYRGILVSSHVAKAYHNTLRDPTMKFHVSTANGLQLGGIPGKGVDFACHTLRTFLQVTKDNQRPCAVFYLDIRSAYYRLLRHLAVGATCTEHGLEKIIATLNLPPEVQRELLNLAHEPDAFTSMGCPDWLRRFGAAFHMNTWFHVRGDPALTATLRGTRPGDGYADLLFNAVLGHTLRSIELDRKSRRLETAIGWNGERFTNAAPGDQQSVEALNVVWADDVAVMVYHDTVDLLLDALPIVFSEYVDRLAAHGLILNFAKNKTELLLLLRGPGSRQHKRKLF